MPEPDPGAHDECDEVTGERPELERQDAEEVGHERAERIRDGREDGQRRQGSEEPDERALEHERPADERVRRADEAHDLDLLRPGEDGQADGVDDDEQRDDPDDDEDDRPRGAQDAGHGQDPLDEVLDVDDVADARVAAQRIADDADLRRIEQLDLHARVERVGVEVAGQVLAALRLHRGPEAGQRLVAADVRDGRDLGHAFELRPE